MAASAFPFDFVAYAVAASVSMTVLYGIIFCIAILVFVMALQRRAIFTSMLSSIMWYSLAFATGSFSDPNSMFTWNVSTIFVLLGVVMTVYTTFLAVDYLRAAAEDQRRRLEEEI